MTRPDPQPRKPARTAAQLAAANPGHSVWVSANAGTGKTHVLIERILRLLLAGTAPGKILTLTFTKAAAAEVTDRLSGRLGHWSAMADDALAQNLEVLLGRPASDAETATARRLFADTIEAPGGLSVRTIHSFCESLLGRFPVEADVAPHFSVVDEYRAAELRAEAQARLLVGETARPAQITAALAHLASLANSDQFAELMKELDSKRGRFRRLLAAPGGADGLIERVRAALGLGPGETRETVIFQACADAAFDGSALEKAAAALDKGSPGDHARAQDIRAWLGLEAAARAGSFEDDYALLFLKKNGEPRAESGLTTKASREADPDAAAILAREQARLATVMDRLKALALADATSALVTVGAGLTEAYATIKRAQALLDYDDLIEKAGSLLADEKGVSWVHYKLDGGIDHILVDEAQDTSPDQWRVITALTADFFAGEGAGDDFRETPRTVFAVGDEKQSIFSFQGADPARFGMTRDHFQARAAAVDQRLPEVELEVSYRSAAAVLRVVDEVFAAGAAADGLTWDGKPVTHHTNRPGQGGLVELWPTLTPEKDRRNREPWAPIDRIAAESPPARLAARIAGTIRGWIETGETLDSAGRPIEAGDIMILVRTRGAFAEEMVRALKRRGVPVTGRDRLKLMDHLAVMDLVAAGRFALMPDDDYNTAVVLKGPFVELDEDALFALAHKRKAGLWPALQARAKETPAFARAEEVLSALLARADTAPPYEFYSHLLGAGGGREALAAHLGAEAVEPIDEFMALALDFERDHEPSLEGFLHWLETGETEVKREMERGRGEVRVLTVHGAKGLEAPVVFLPDTCAVPDPRKDPPILWHDGGDGCLLWRLSTDDEDTVTADLRADARRHREREYRRLLYVAMTRARDRLYVCGWENKNGRGNGCWYDLVLPAVRALGEKAMTEAGETVVRVGSPQEAPPDGGTAMAVTAEVPENPPPWAVKPPAPEPSPPQPLAPSVPSEDEPTVLSPVFSPWGPDGGARFRRGIAIHRLLQGLPDVPPEAREAAARAYLARPALGLEPGELDDIVAETIAVLSDPAIAALFGPGSLAEVPVTGIVEGRTGPFVLSGQVDRLLVTADTVTVVDYKTNRPPPEAEEDVDPRYLRQMAAYRRALSGAYPGRRVQGILLWTAGPRIMALSDDVLDAHAP